MFPGRSWIIVECRISLIHARVKDCRDTRSVLGDYSVIIEGIMHTDILSNPRNNLTMRSLEVASS